MPTNIQGPGDYLNLHDHTSGLGLGAGRVADGLTAARPAFAAGMIYLATDPTALSIADAGAWHTVLLADAIATISALWKFDVGQDWKQIATPGSNPAAGYNRVYVKSDGNLYILDSAGTESLVGFVPTGMVVPYFGTVLPANTLWADGHSEVVATYQRLSDIIRPTTGGADASHFYVPDQRSRGFFGADNYGAGAAGRTAIAINGTTGGEDTHALTSGENGTHTHIQDAHGHTTASGANFYSDSASGAAFSPSGVGDHILKDTNLTATQVATNQNSGSGTAHNNRPLYLGCNAVIGI